MTLPHFAPASILALGIGGVLWAALAAAPPPAPPVDPAVIAVEATVAAVRTAVALELGPAPTPTALPTAVKPSPTPAVDMDDLFVRLRGYKAAGATRSLETAVNKTLHGTGKPVGDTFAWQLARKAGQTYTLTMRATYANEPLTLTWTYNDATGHLQADDWQTRWASGW
jgi:hypothetical protein